MAGKPARPKSQTSAAAPAGGAAEKKSDTPYRVGGPLIVAMGASAGGLEAYQKFFADMPEDNRMAFVLVPHLDAHHKSAMTDLVQRATKMKVVEITDGMPLEPARVHVIPPNATLTIQ